MNILRIIGVAAFVLLGIKYLRPGGVPIFALFVLLVFISGLRNKLYNSFGPNVRLLFLVFWCYLLVQLLDLLRSIDINQSITDLLKYAGLVTSLYIFGRFNRFDRLLFDAKTFALISSVLLVYFFTNSYFVLQSPYMSADLFLRTEQGKNGLAMFSAIGCIVCSWLVFTRSIKHKWIFFICFFICAASLVYTQSRGALFMLVISSVVTYSLLLWRKSGPRISRLLKVTAAISLFAAYLAYVFSSLNIIDQKDYFEQLTSLGTGRLTASDEVRKSLIEKGWRLFIDNPLVGIGTNNFQYKYELLTHNQYLQFAVENGFFIAAAVIVVFIFIIRNFYIHQKQNEYDPLFHMAFHTSLFIFLYFIFINAYDTILTQFCLVICVKVLDERMKVNSIKNMAQ